MDKNQALSKAMAYCARQEHAEGEVRGKLRSWGLTENDTDQIISKLIQEKCLDNERYARAFVRDKLTLNGWGRIKIRYMLHGKGVESRIIDKALDEIDEEHYLGILKDLLEKKARTLKNEENPLIVRQKLINFAMGRGFEPDRVVPLLRMIQ